MVSNIRNNLKLFKGMFVFLHHTSDYMIMDFGKITRINVLKKTRMEKIIINYLNDSISDEELGILKVWLQKPKNKEKFKDFVRLNNTLNETSYPIDGDAAFRNISMQIKKNSTSKRSLQIAKYAAVLIGISIIGYGMFRNTTDASSTENTPQITLKLEDGSIKIVSSNKNTIITDASGNKISEQKDNQLVYNVQSDRNETLQYNTLIVPYGKTFGLTLSDGSKITLNAGSQLKYPVRFIKNEKNRTVFLNGEAFFEVAKNAAQPFIVNAQDMNVEVLGTQFNVTSYLKDTKTYTVLVEGTVAAHNKISKNDSKILSPNERVFFEGKQLKTEFVNVQKYVAWVKGELVFIDDFFTVICNKLERKYNVEIINNYPELDGIMITARFKTETLDDILKTFQTYKPFHYTIQKGIVTISKPK